MDNAQTGAMTDRNHEQQTVGILLGLCAGNLPCFSPIITGNFGGF